jgi:branched-chain amino acid transport system substrate-binding protein
MNALLKRLMSTLATVAAACGAVPGHAAIPNEQFFPVLVFRSGAYAPNGVPWANGFVDYLNLVNERDGGIGGVKITYEECETGYSTDRGVECYERLKGKGPTGATSFNPLSTGITFALGDKVAADRIPLITMGYGRSESTDGSVFKWNFPLLGTYWDAADMLRARAASRSCAAARSRCCTTTRHTARSRSRCCRRCRTGSASSSSRFRWRTPAWSRRPPGCRSARPARITFSCGAGV